MKPNLDIKNYKTEIMSSVDNIKDTLKEIALNIHSNPELAFNEHKAVKWLTEPLENKGFQVDYAICGLDTSFLATWEGSKGGPTIAFLAEYDALPEIGHACGHNIIGTAAVGAAIALKEACPELKAEIKVIGTPAEEGGGGKIMMCEQGIFNDVDIAMMCHPKNKTMVLRGGLACVTSTFKFYGKESHASSAPEQGVSALDAVINSFVAINGIREYVSDDVRIHGIITKGGSAPNVVPNYCEANFIIRAATTKKLEAVKKKVYKAVKGSSEAAGADCEIEEGLIYAERNNNKKLAELFQKNLTSMNIEVSEPPKQGGLGSSDIGNVSQITATIHPYIKIGEANNHTIDFANEAKSEEGINALYSASKAMAMTAFDLCTDENAFKLAREEFENWKLNQK